MSIGNLKTDGGKGTNWPWQYKMLKGLQGIIDVINSTANGSEYEAKLVNITCTGVPFNGTELYLEVRVWDTVTGGFTDISYYLPGDDTEYPALDFATCTIAYLEAGDATEATLAAILAMNTLIEGDTTAIATSTSNTDTNTNQIEVNTSPITGVVADLRRETASGTVGLLVRSASIANVGTEDGEVLGVTLAAGETVTFDAGLNNTLAAISYDPTTPGAGTTFLIATLT